MKTAARLVYGVFGILAIALVTPASRRPYR